MIEPVLLIENREGIATLTLNRPQARNALSQELRTALVQAFHRLRSDPDNGVIILTGSGRAFCAGLDLKELSGLEGDASQLGSIVAEQEDVVHAMESCELPILGAVNGPAIAGGIELALACDLVIASTAASFADTHVKLGVLPGWGLSQKLSRAIGVARAKELSLTGNTMSAEQAASWGLVNRVVAPDELLPTCRTVAKDILQGVPESVRAMKRVIDAGYRVSLTEGLQIEGQAFKTCASQITPEIIADRRAGIQQRGRTSSSATRS